MRSVVRVLELWGLPASLGHWALEVWVLGRSDLAAALSYVIQRVAPAFGSEEEPLTGQRQITFRVPADWTARRAIAWVEYVYATFRDDEVLEQTFIEAPRGGPAPKVTRAEAIDLAERFDKYLAERRRSQGVVRPIALKAWLREFDARLTETGGDAHGTAESLWRMHVRPALERGETRLPTLQVPRRLHEASSP